MNASAMPTTAGRGRDAVPAPRPDDRGTPMTHLLYVAGIFCLAAWFPASIQIGALLIIVGSFGRLRRPVAIPWAVLIFIGWIGASIELERGSKAVRTALAADPDAEAPTA